MSTLSASVEPTPSLREAISGLSRAYRKRMRCRKSSTVVEETPEMAPGTTSETPRFPSRSATSSSLGYDVPASQPVGTLATPEDHVTSLPAPMPTTNPLTVVKASMRWRRSANRAGREHKAIKRYQHKPLKPYIKFRRAARAVMLIQRVCRVCKDLVYEAVCSEEWYAKIDTFVAASTPGLAGQNTKRVRPFRTLVPNEKKELVQLTFDRSEFFKERRVDLTDDMRTLLSMKASERTPEQKNEVLRFLKRASPPFNSFPLASQREMVQCMWFDTYLKDRVITKQGSQADSIFFVLSGKLVEKAKDRKTLSEIKQGEGFGEEDLKCACPRRTTVLTQTMVELITIHRQDYRAICNMCDDSHDPRYLDICKQDLVFQHFPVHKLIDNPAVWTVLSYKFGCLMVKDSNEMEWIYIIKSGEARVIKHLAAADFNLRSRRKAIEARRNQESAYFRRRQIIDFVSNTESPQRQKGLTSAPAGLTLAQQRRRRIGLASCPGGRYHSAEFGDVMGSQNPVPRGGTSRQRRVGPGCEPCLPVVAVEGEQLNISGSSSGSEHDPLRLRPHTTAMNTRRAAVARASRATRPTSVNGKVPVEIRIEDMDANPAIPEDPPHHPNNPTTTETTTITALSENLSISPQTSPTKDSQTVDSPSSPCKPLVLSASTRGGYMSTSHRNLKAEGAGVGESTLKFPLVGGTASSQGSGTPRTPRKNKNALMVKVPPFVQLESLHPGRVFGLRSCLDPDERGPSASLVSGGCEVLQINKKFFMKHADEAIISLIKLKYKAFPSDEELVDRLDVNIRWEEYKQSTVLDFLRVRGREAHGYNTAFVSVS